MKKIFSLVFLLFILYQIQAQTTEFRVQSIPRALSSLSAPTKPLIADPQIVNISDTSFSMNEIVNWIGTGSKRAAMLVQWNDGKQPDAMVWGYRWDGDATGADMIKAITQSDPRFFLLIKNENDNTTIIGGVGYDLNTKNRIKLNVACSDQTGNERIFTTNKYNFDDWKCDDPLNHWCSGWNKDFWSYNVRESNSKYFTESNKIASERLLQDGSWDGWCYSKVNHSRPDFLDVFTASPKIDYTTGVFFLNAGWFMKDNGSLNYLNSNGEFSYRVYSKENGMSKKFGVRTDFGTIFDGKLFVISKQNRRIVVADAETLKEITTINLILPPSRREANGRAFLGITPELGYISTSIGICTINLKNYTIGEYISGTEGETGSMIRTANYVFAVQKKRVLILKDNTVVSTISGCNYSSICQSKDGMVWIAAGAVLIKVDPVTLAQKKLILPRKAAIGNSWDDWNEGSFCADTQTNALYWTNSGMFDRKKDIYRYDTGNIISLMKPIYSLPQDQMFWGTGIRVHPVTNLLYLISTNASLANFDQNRVIVLDATGKLIQEYKLFPYNWFPVMPVFPDGAAKFAPETVVENSSTKNQADQKHKPAAYRSGDRLLNLPHGAVIEAYNMTGALLFKVKAEQNEFIIPHQGFLIFNIISADGIQVIN